MKEIDTTRIAFAMLTLRTLAEQKVWSAYTLDTIAQYAMELGLAWSDGDFHVTQEALFRSNDHV